MRKTIAQGYYKEGIEKGKLEGVQQTILQMGRTRFGARDESIQLAINAIDNPEQLKAQGERILVACSWSDLLKPS